MSKYKEIITGNVFTISEKLFYKLTSTNPIEGKREYFAEKEMVDGTLQAGLEGGKLIEIKEEEYQSNLELVKLKNTEET